MTRIKSLFFCFLAVAILFVACEKREGVVPSKKKIDKVMAIENRYQDSEQIFMGDEYVAEQWTWDGNKVIRIDYRGENQYQENFFYDGRKIIRTTVPAYNLRSEFTYDGRKLEKIDIYQYDNLAATMGFVHNDDGVSEIVYRCIVFDSDMKCNVFAPLPLRVLVGSDAAQTIGRDVEKQMLLNRSAKSASELHYSLTWDINHESVIGIAVSGNVETPYSISLTYDDKKNPYDQLFANHEFDESVFGFRMLSEHNVTSISMPFENRGVVDFKYSYTYEEDYPSTRNLTYSYFTMGVLFDTVTIRVEMNERYYYK